MSISSGDLTVNGKQAHYELRMPQYELTHIQNPDRSLLEHIRFSSHGQAAGLLSGNCALDSISQAFVCRAEYEFAEAPDRIDVECTFASITVPNHIHLLRAEMNQRNDQAVFDLTFPRSTLRFRPPTPLEVAATQTGAGVVRAWGGAVQLLFLAALVLAGRTRKELLALAGMFVAGQVASVLVLAKVSWQPAPRFIEAAAALTVAYLALEILLLPKAGARWAVAAALGVFHGLFFYLFLQSTKYHAGYVLGGAALAEVLTIAVFALVLSRIRSAAPLLRPVQSLACGLLAFGAIWFVMRLRG